MWSSFFPFDRGENWGSQRKKWFVQGQQLVEQLPTWAFWASRLANCLTRYSIFLFFSSFTEECDKRIFVPLLPLSPEELLGFEGPLNPNQKPCPPNPLLTHCSFILILVVIGTCYFLVCLPVFQGFSVEQNQSPVIRGKAWVVLNPYNTWILTRHPSGSNAFIMISIQTRTSSSTWAWKRVCLV